MGATFKDTERELYAVIAQIKKLEQTAKKSFVPLLVAPGGPALLGGATALFIAEETSLCAQAGALLKLMGQQVGDPGGPPAVEPSLEDTVPRNPVVAGAAGLITFTEQNPHLLSDAAASAIEAGRAFVTRNR
jgi:hypothetical protein